MPIRPPTVTSAFPAGCHMGPKPVSYRAKRLADPKLAVAERIRSSRPWKSLRAHFLAMHPVCGACGAALAQQTHHLVPIERAPHLALDWENLAPVCTRCHGDCNARERKGLETASLFAGFKRLSRF